MSRARHKSSGGICKPSEAGGNKNVMDEAKSSKDTMPYKDGGCVGGGMSKMRLDRPGRKLGGRVFSNPLSSGSATAPMSAAGKGK